MRRKHSLVFGCCFLGAALLTAPLLNAEESLEERRTRVAGMSPEEKHELLQKQARFARLSPEEQQRLRELHDKLDSSPDSQRLAEVLERYHAWLATLTSQERGQLLSLPANERLTKIQEKLREQEEQRFRKLVAAKLQPEDRRAIFQWLEQFVEAHQDEILAAIPEEHRPQGDFQGRMRWGMMFLVLRGWAENQPALPRPTSEEVQQLISTLSPQAQQSLAKAPDDRTRLKQAQEWIRAAVMSRSVPPVNPEELRRFYAEDLSSQERERLENLSGEELQSALQRLYYENRVRRQWGRPPFRGPGRGGRDMDRPPPDGPSPDRPPGERARGPGRRPPPPEERENSSSPFGRGPQEDF